MDKFIEWFKSLNFEFLSIIGAIIYFIVIIYTIFKIIKNTVNPSKAIGYLLIVVILPIIGVILYFSIGMNYRLEKLYKRKYTHDRNFYQIIRNEINEHTEKRILRYNKLLEGKIHPIRMLLNDSSSALYIADRTELLINGENKFRKVLEELKKAKKHIHIEYYIFADDNIGNEIKEILLEKAKEGVTVRFIYDDFGSHSLNKRMIKELREGGVQVAAFYKIKLYAFANRMNYRNHRKIIIIDSKVGFIGGINVDDRYINSSNSKLYWRDTHFMVEGEAVNGLQYNFITDWNFCSGNDVDPFDKDYFHKSSPVFAIDKNPELMQIAASGPDSDRATIMLVYNGIIMSSRKRLYLTTPYLIPNETIVNALKYAALSGVDVRILVPYKSDSIIVNAASCAYYKELLASGVRIYRYTKGFVHAKTIISDTNLSVIGSANLDMRSFDLNFEISALVYSETINQELYDAFMEDIGNSTEVTYREWIKRNKLVDMGNSIAKLISPLL
ncbi:cardiolipin synthase [uncultured Apibacter sp.]|uniref:cardiolipin synthase n=1 Tax=uncultured Apibacter sp. TaxID=1778616 RepID=UPI0025D6CD42|nr:cardiolipin synthase [uncultured Apibacter sp.]